MACLGITGMMRTAPTAAIDVILGLPACNCNWRLRPEQELTDPPSVINENPNLKVLDMHERRTYPIDGDWQNDAKACI
jgi:hypothetical protein